MNKWTNTCVFFMVSCQMFESGFVFRGLYLQGLVYFVVDTCSHLHSSTNAQALPRDVARKK